RSMNSCETFEALTHGRHRSTAPLLAGLLLERFLLSSQTRGKSAARRQRGARGVQDEVAVPLHQYRHRDGLEKAAMLERLELIELEDAVDSTALPNAVQRDLVKGAAVLPE